MTELRSQTRGGERRDCDTGSGYMKWGGLSPERIDRVLRTWPELDLHMQLACKLKSRRNEGGMGYQGTQISIADTA
jgi:hypothetical protein